MIHLENFNSYDSGGNKPITKSVSEWVNNLDKRYKIIIINDEQYGELKSIIIDEKNYYLSKPLVNKSRLRTKIFFAIKSEMEESRIHVPSLKKAIKIWIDKKTI